MESLLGFIHYFSLSAWIGSLLLLFVVVTPTVFRVLSDELAQTLDYHLHSAYYPLAAACGVGALVSLVGIQALRGGVSWFWVRAGLLVVMTLLTLNVAGILHPRIVRMSHAMADFDPREDETDPRARRLLRLQKLSWQTNGVVLLLGLITLWLSVGGPRT
jgi:hypothetical protein